MDAEMMEAILGPDPVLFECLISDLMTIEKGTDTLLMLMMMQNVAPDLVALKLVDLLGSSPDIDTRAMCLVLLKPMMLTDELTLLTQSLVKSTLLRRIIQIEETDLLIQDLCRFVAVLADSALPRNNWPELLPFLNQLLCATCSDSNRRLHDYFFLIFAHLAPDVAKTLVPDIMISRSLFLNRLADDTLDHRVKLAVFTTAFTFIRCLPSLNERQWFQNLLPAAMRALTDALNNGEESQVLAQIVLCKLIDLGEDDPRFFRMQLIDVISTMFDITEATSLDEKTRFFAVKFVLTLVEARVKAPGMMRKLPLFANTCFAVFLNLVVNIKDDPNWHSTEPEHEGAGETNFYLGGIQGLKQLSIALGGKAIAPIAVDQLSASMVAPEWEKRHGALIALGFISKGCSKAMIKYLEQIGNMVLHSFQDPHPRVRWAAIFAMAELLTYIGPELLEQYHNQVFLALAAVLDDFQNPRLQALAATTFRRLFGYKKPETLVPYLDRILSKLTVLLQNDSHMVQEAALTAFSVIAYLCKEHFQKFYDFVMPYLKTILINATDHILQSIALGHISFIGMAVRKETFKDDLEQVMEVLKSLQESQVKDIDTIRFLQEACCKICMCIGKDFLPYMSTVMPPLFECAQFDPAKSDSSDELGHSIQKVTFGDEIICASGRDILRTKSIACIILGSYAHILKERFYPWISQAASILVPLLKFYIHTDVRENAIYAMYPLLLSAELAVEKGNAQGGKQSYFKQLSSDIILAMADALYSESETKLCACILCELHKCLEIRGSLSEEDHVRCIIDAIKHVMTESSRRKEELAARAKSEDFDAEEDELLREERELEEDVFCGVDRILVTLIRTVNVAFLPFLDDLLSYLTPMMGKDKTAGERNICINVFNEIVVHCGEAALKYYKLYLPFLLVSSNNEHPVVRKNALYGLELCAVSGDYVLKPWIGEALSRISVVIKHFRAHEPMNDCAYVRAISALGMICLFQESVDSVQIFPGWLNCLPIKADTVEARAVHAQLCSMIERSDNELLGPNYEHFPKIISVASEVLCARKDLATEETAKRMINLLRNLQKIVPLATWASTRSLLLPQQEMELESILLHVEDAFSSVQ